MAHGIRAITLSALLSFPLAAADAWGQDFGARGDSENLDDVGLLNGVVPVPGVWSGSLGLGASLSSGTSESTSVNGRLRLLGDFERWEHLLRATMLRSSQTVLVEQRGPDGEPVMGPDGEVLRSEETRDGDDRTTASYAPRRFFSPSLYAFGLFDYEQDEPANVERGLRGIFGAGYRVYESDLSALSFEAGAGYKSTDLVEGEDIDGAILYLGASWFARVADAIRLSADARADFGDDNNFYELALGAGVDLTEILSLEAEHVVRGNSDIDAGPDTLDDGVSNSTTLSLVLIL